MKTYSQQCLERAEKTSVAPWGTKSAGDYLDVIEDDGKGTAVAINLTPGDAEFIAHSRTDVVELARRLQDACKFLRLTAAMIPALMGVVEILERPL